MSVLKLLFLAVVSSDPAALGAAHTNASPGKKQKSSKHGSKQSRVVQLSKAMAHLLRHDLENAKIPFDPSGG